MEGGTSRPRPRLRGLLLNRYVLVVAVVLVAAAVPSAMAAFRAHSVAPTVASSSSGGAARSIQGGVPPSGAKPHAGIVKPGNRPQASRQTKPVERHLKKAGSAVFDVRSLKSTVVKRERSERTSPFDREHEGAASSAPSKVS